MHYHTPMTERQKIILDCDPGQDDALAILLALGSGEELDLLGITTVAGNVPLDLTKVNARKICELANRPDVKVFEGCSRPILRPLVTAEYVHGKTGLDGADLPAPTMPLQDQHAVDFIVETIMTEAAGQITLCPIGPLTNIALAMVKQPEIIPRIKEIVLMGGAMSHGNVTPAAEFNIYVDPHAARVVFEAGVRKKGTSVYSYDLTVDYYAFAEEVDGDNYKLIDHGSSTFLPSAENKESHSFSGEDIRIGQVAVRASAPLRGTKYGGYLVTLTDQQGRIIQHKTSHEWLFEKLEKLKKIPVGKHFDKACDRVGPPRPGPADRPDWI